MKWGIYNTEGHYIGWTDNEDTMWNLSVIHGLKLVEIPEKKTETYEDIRVEIFDGEEKLYEVTTVYGEPKTLEKGKWANEYVYGRIYEFNDDNYVLVYTDNGWGSVDYFFAQVNTKEVYSLTEGDE